MQIETVDALIASSRPRRRLLRGSMLLLLALSMFLGASLADPKVVSSNLPLGWLVPQLLLLTMIGLVLRHGLRQRRTSRLMLQAFESVQLREWDRASDLLQQLLRHPLRYRTARAESLLALAAVAESEQDHATAQHIYEAVVLEQEAEPLQMYTAQLGLAGAMLRTQQTTDAVALIDRLRRNQVPDALRAQVELLALYRDITMGQVDAAIEAADQRRELFRRHLSTGAGHGYALLALAFHRAGRVEEAGQLWHDATLLVRAADLLRRYPELKDVTGRYPAVEHAL